MKYWITWRASVRQKDLHLHNTRHKLNNECLCASENFPACDFYRLCVTAVFSVLSVSVCVFRAMGDSSRVRTPCSVPINPGLIHFSVPGGSWWGETFCQSGLDHLHSQILIKGLDSADLLTTPPQGLSFRGVCKHQRGAAFWLAGHHIIIVSFNVWKPLKPLLWRNGAGMIPTSDLPANGGMKMVTLRLCLDWH